VIYHHSLHHEFFPQLPLGVPFYLLIGYWSILCSRFELHYVAVRCWVGLGWVTSDYISRGLGWVGLQKMDPRICLVLRILISSMAVCLKTLASGSRGLESWALALSLAVGFWLWLHHWSFGTLTIEDYIVYHKSKKNCTASGALPSNPWSTPPQSWSHPNSLSGPPMHRWIELSWVWTFIYGTKIAETQSEWRRTIGWNRLPSAELTLKQKSNVVINSLLYDQSQPLLHCNSDVSNIS